MKKIILALSGLLMFGCSFKSAPVSGQCFRNVDPSSLTSRVKVIMVTSINGHATVHYDLLENDDPQIGPDYRERDQSSFLEIYEKQDCQEYDALLVLNLSKKVEVLRDRLDTNELNLNRIFTELNNLKNKPSQRLYKGK